MPWSPEELYVRKNLIESMPDVVVNVVDASNIERNLYLTTQLIDMNLRSVIALNMYDELQSKGDKLDIKQLSYLGRIPAGYGALVQGMPNTDAVHEWRTGDTGIVVELINHTRIGYKRAAMRYGSCYLVGYQAT